MIAAISEWQIGNDSAERWYIQMDHLQNAMRSTRRNIYLKKRKENTKRRLLQFAPPLRSISVGCEGVAALQRDATMACILAGSCRGHAATAPFIVGIFATTFLT